MRNIVHLSDIHFGRIDYAIIEPLIKLVAELQPHLVAVSGDLTQRARSSQFKEARTFLDALPQPQIVVPGNHDVPLHNVFQRFLQPLDKYKKYITDDLEPFYKDEEIAVIGINTARSLTIKSGRINEAQVARIRERLCHLDDRTTKILVTHHPFDLPDGYSQNDLVGRAQMAMQTLAQCGTDVLLAGHMHIGHTGHTAKRYRISGHSALVVQAGTATSTRGRGEANSFNLLCIENDSINIDRYSWSTEQGTFVVSGSETFQRETAGWERVESNA